MGFVQEPIKGSLFQKTATVEPFHNGHLGDRKKVAVVERFKQESVNGLSAKKVAVVDRFKQESVCHTTIRQKSGRCVEIRLYFTLRTLLFFIFKSVDDIQVAFISNILISWSVNLVTSGSQYVREYPHTQSNTRNLDCISLFPTTILVHHTVHSLIPSA